VGYDGRSKLCQPQYVFGMMAKSGKGTGSSTNMAFLATCKPNSTRRGQPGVKCASDWDVTCEYADAAPFGQDAVPVQLQRTKRMAKNGRIPK
jgi:hypothetical protein